MSVGRPSSLVSRPSLEDGRWTMDDRRCGRNSVVECQLPKLDVVGSNPIARFFILLRGSVYEQSPQRKSSL
jgi:hypothetical protein